MKITGGTITPTMIPLVKPSTFSGGTRMSAPGCILQIETDEGVTGPGLGAAEEVREMVFYDHDDPGFIPRTGVIIPTVRARTRACKPGMEAMRIWQ